MINTQKIFYPHKIGNLGFFSGKRGIIELHYTYKLFGALYFYGGGRMGEDLYDYREELKRKGHKKEDHYRF